MLNHIFPYLFLGCIRVVLSGNQDRIDSLYLVPVIFNGNLGLSVRSEICKGAVLSHICKPLCQLVSVGNGSRHKFRGFVAGKPKHYSLVAGTDGVDLVLVRKGAVLVFERFVNSHGDVPGLFIDCRKHRAGVAVKAVFRTIIAYVKDNLSYDFGNVNITFCRNFPHNHGISRGSRGFRGNSAVRVFLENRVQNCVRNLVAELIRMPLGYGFRCE